MLQSRGNAWNAVLAVLVWLISIPLACCFGPLDIPLSEVWQLLGVRLGCVSAQAVDASRLLVVGDMRLARVVLALLCGGGLALAGSALQGVLRNPLADPFTLGVAAGAACGASLVISFGGAGVLLWWGGSAIAIAAFAGALAALGAALWLGRSDGGLRRENVVLAGIAVATFLGAIVALIKALNEESVTSIVFWIMGSFQGRGWESLPLLLVPLLLGSFPVALLHLELDLLLLGDMQAAQLGVRVGSVRVWLLAGAGCMTAGCVAVAGVIGFVGLVVPHILRRCLGAAHGPLLLASWFWGGILLLWSDVVARSLLSGGQELPVGVVTALLGGPFFALLLRSPQRLRRGP